MGMFDFLKPKPKTDKELQAELRALCNTIVPRGGGWDGDWDRYENLLAEIYKRGLKPEIWLMPKEEKGKSSDSSEAK